MTPAKIPLSGKRGAGKFMLVDVEDVPKLAGIRWHLTDNGYAVNRTRGTNIRAHRLIMNTPKGMDTDHRNRDRLDNRKSNLRVCTRSENLQNKAAIGVWLDKRRGTWQAEITVNKKKRYLGAYKTREEAMEVYRRTKKS